MRRSFGFDPGSPPRVLCAVGWDVLACPHCGGRLRLIALIEEPQVIRRILGHLGLPTEVPTAVPRLRHRFPSSVSITTSATTPPSREREVKARSLVETGEVCPLA